jgi:hypothetical protein
MVKLRECKTNEIQNKLQRVQWKKQTQEENLGKDGRTRLKGI